MVGAWRSRRGGSSHSPTAASRARRSMTPRRRRARRWGESPTGPPLLRVYEAADRAFNARGLGGLRGVLRGRLPLERPRAGLRNQTGNAADFVAMSRQMTADGESDVRKRTEFLSATDRCVLGRSTYAGTFRGGPFFEVVRSTSPWSEGTASLSPPTCSARAREDAARARVEELEEEARAVRGRDASAPGPPAGEPPVLAHVRAEEVPRSTAATGTPWTTRTTKRSSLPITAPSAPGSRGVTPGRCARWSARSRTSAWHHEVIEVLAPAGRCSGWSGRPRRRRRPGRDGGHPDRGARRAWPSRA